jgi:hypothetical protein
VKEERQRAANFVPSSEEVIARQSFVPSPTVISVQFAPLLLEVHMLPPRTSAASFVPSVEEVIPAKLLPFEGFIATRVTSVQVALLLLEVHMLERKPLMDKRSRFIFAVH